MRGCFMGTLPYNYLMKKLLTLILLFVSLLASATNYYVSPSGSDSNTGLSTASPMLSLNHAWTHVSAGDKIYMRGGTYTYAMMGGETDLSNKSGTVNDSICILNYPNEHPIINFSANTFTSAVNGIHVANVSYLHIKGIRITSINQPHDGSDYARGLILWSYVSNCLFELMEIDHIGGWGVHISDYCNNNVFLNIDSHHNADRWSPSYTWGAADGFQSNSWDNGVPGATSTGNTFIGCRAYWNSDDGWDLRRCDGLWTFINCWSFWNGYQPGEKDGDDDGDRVTAGGDGEGLKLSGTFGSSTTDIRRVVNNCLVFENRATAIDGWMDNGYVGMHVYNTVAYNNDVGFAFEDASGATTSILRNNISYGNSHGNYFGSQTWLQHDHNNWDGAATVADNDFVSVSSIGMDGPRQADGSLPILNFLKPATGSDIINAGTDVGLSTDGAGNAWATPNPSIGAYEYGATPPEDIHVESVSVAGTGGVTTITTDNGTLQMVETVLPANATNKVVSWSITNGSGSGSVSSSGLLTAATDGTVTVRATATDGTGYYGDRVITISNQVIIEEGSTVVSSGGHVISSGGHAVVYVP
jgi:hypothetical protein